MFMEDVKLALLFNELRKKVSGSEAQAEGLITGGRPKEKGSDTRCRLKSRSKKTVECYYCQVIVRSLSAREKQ